MSYLRLAIAAIEGFGVLTKVLIALGLAASLLAAYSIWHHRIYQSGVDDTIAGIAREDARYINRARAARAKWKECSDSGRSWNQTTGRCQ